MKKIIFLVLSSLSLFAQDNSLSLSIAEAIKTDLVASISTELSKQALASIHAESDKLEIKSQQSAGLDFVYRPELQARTRYNLLLDLTKGHKDRVEIFLKALEDNLLDAYYSKNLLELIPIKANRQRILELLELKHFQNEKSASFVAEVYKNLAKIDAQYSSDFFNHSVKVKYYFSDDDTKFLIEALRKGQLKVSKDSQWILLQLVLERYSSSHCKFAHLFFQEYYNTQVESKDPYKDYNKLFDAFYPLWLEQE
jgi:hypothetical protein